VVVAVGRGAPAEHIPPRRADEYQRRVPAARARPPAQPAGADPGPRHPRALRGAQELPAAAVRAGCDRGRVLVRRNNKKSTGKKRDHTLRRQVMFLWKSIDTSPILMVAFILPL